MDKGYTTAIESIISRVKNPSVCNKKSLLHKLILKINAYKTSYGKMLYKEFKAYL